MGIENISLNQIENNSLTAASFIKEWMKRGVAVYIPCEITEIAAIFQKVYKHIDNNFFIILGDDGLNKNDFNIRNIKVIDKDFINLEDEIKNKETHFNLKLQKTTGILLFCILYDIRIKILPPHLFNKMLSKKWSIYGNYRYEGRFFFVFTNRIIPDGNANKVRFYMGQSDYGASVITYPILFDVIKRFNKMGKNVELLYDKKVKNYSIFFSIFDKCVHVSYSCDITMLTLPKKLEEDYREAKFIYSVINYEFINQTYISHFNHCHIVSEMLAMAGYENSEMTYDQLLSKTQLPNLLLSEKSSNIIRDIRRKHKYVIAIQLYTETDLYYTEKYKALPKSWPKEEVENFLYLCQKHDIAVINLAPTYYPLKVSYDFCDLSLGEIFGIIKQTDLVVGIDSVCTHIAGVLKVPNITLWRRYYPFDLSSPNGGRNMSFRAVSMNYSLVDRSINRNKITAHIVIDRVISILERRITLQDKFINYDDRTNLEEYVDE